MITADQLWAAVKRGESDATIAARIGRSERSVRYLRTKYRVPSATKLGTAKRDSKPREIEVMPLPPDDPGMVGQKPIMLPDPEEEERWHRRLSEAGMFEDVRVRRAPRFRAQADTPVLRQSIMA